MDYPQFLLLPPITYFDKLMTGFVNRINAANQSVDRNLKLPTWQGTVEYYPIRCLLDGG